jgi:hypothetical protein
MAAEVEAPSQTVAAYPQGDLPPLRVRDLPDPVPLRRMIGPSIMLAGLALGSGEFIFWPYITYKIGFTFIWACLIGVVTQYFLNMEITRWALATGESAITGFARLSKHWAGLFLFLNTVPWMIPAWALGTSEMISWLVWSPEPSADGAIHAPHITIITVATLLLCGIALTAGPVIYETVERIQLFLVSFILILVVILGFRLIRPDAFPALLNGIVSLKMPPPTAGLDAAMLLGAIAFAGAGGTMNLGQSNYVKEKGYGMGQYIGRMTSPITGKEEAVSELGYCFPLTDANLSRWRSWWRAANVEHFLSFFCTCLLCLFVLAMISYSVFYTPEGVLKPGAAAFGKDTAFLFGEAQAVEQDLGSTFRALFLIMGAAILFTTEIGVLDAASRISTDVVKVNWLRENKAWSESRLYYLFLWGTILAAIGVVTIGERIWPGLSGNKVGFFKLTASMNGAVMFIYSALLLYLNYFKLPAAIRMNGFRALMLVWSTLFFGFFAFWTGWRLLTA